MPLSGPPLEKTVQLSQLLRIGLETKPDDSALISTESRWSWREADRASDRLAANLLALGLRPGDRVASLMPNRTALVIHYLACMKAGLVAVPLNYRYMPPEIDHALEVSEASILLAHAERDADVDASKLASKLPLGQIRYGASEGARDGQSPRFERLVEQNSPAAQLPTPDPTAPAFIFFTSGSTGPAKGVTHSLDTLGWIVASTREGLGCTSDDAFLTASSLSHEGGVRFALAALAGGACTIVGRNSDGDELLPLMRAHRPTVIWMLPASLIRLIRDHAATKEDFASFRLCMSGGDKAPLEMEREFTDLTGLAIHECYGMTEIGGATLNPPSGVNKPGSIGCLSHGYACSIRDESSRELTTDEEGRLWIKSPAEMIGYWGNPDANQATFRDGWLDTGDVMKVDRDGYLWFCGRKKQIIVHDGSNICPQEVEDALAEHPAVATAGVIGIHDLVHGENVRAYITLKEGAPQPTSQELIQFARARVGYKAPDDIVLLDHMPLTVTGKVDRTALKRMAEDSLGG